MTIKKILSSVFIFSTLIGCSGIGKTGTGSENEDCVAKTYQALTDFTLLNIEGFKAPYKDKNRTALAVDATKFKGDFAAAAITFDGVNGKYDIKINTMAELDGESKYRISINDKTLTETFQNPRINGTDKPDYTPASYTWQGVKLNEGDEIRVEFSSETNGLIPEGDITAYSRGRWTSLELLCR